MKIIILLTYFILAVYSHTIVTVVPTPKPTPVATCKSNSASCPVVIGARAKSLGYPPLSMAQFNSVKWIYDNVYQVEVEFMMGNSITKAALSSLYLKGLQSPGDYLGGKIELFNKTKKVDKVGSAEQHFSVTWLMLAEETGRFDSSTPFTLEYVWCQKDDNSWIDQYCKTTTKSFYAQYLIDCPVDGLTDAPNVYWDPQCNAPRPEPETTTEVPEPDPTTEDPVPTTEEPETTTEDPKFTTEDPETSTEDPVPTTEDPVPTTEDPEPTTEEPEPTTEDPEPTTEEPEPTTEDPESTTEDPESTTEDPVPTTEDPVPTTEDPVPTTEDPEPTTEDPVPTTEDPVPTTEDPVPTTEDPEPTTEDPVPTTQDPVPTTEDPVPTTEDPEPTTEDPVPTTQDPVPTTQDPVPTTEDPDPKPTSQDPESPVTKQSTENTIFTETDKGSTSEITSTVVVTTLVESYIPETSYISSSANDPTLESELPHEYEQIEEDPYNSQVPPIESESIAAQPTSPLPSEEDYLQGSAHFVSANNFALLTGLLINYFMI
ncbi:uncharacterized protein SPAPADRAFT_49639 [Spathaspora passalidarum NRRL Y-27907]|uniref:Flo11 domain-containing protein n=1 Tax=Spathaspora passalidarum (strain NRRL Y-27907 / 11-Y1) TaxID=619300 RepID=G3AJF1_SPAPN|nr:uncharacterized protein SPAPADRAFT_49639 [Spathaspora passalidarum NRRL Y-27907]EGW34610.1 hypothetical protein SPAPADRAFT_49639 [Spathaspora passalidarum NRRL Y-27907]